MLFTYIHTPCNCRMWDLAGIIGETAGLAVGQVARGDQEDRIGGKVEETSRVGVMWPPEMQKCFSNYKHCHFWNSKIWLEFFGLGGDGANFGWSCRHLRLSFLLILIGGGVTGLRVRALWSFYLSTKNYGPSGIWALDHVLTGEIICLRSDFVWTPHKLTQNRCGPPLGRKKIFSNIGFIAFKMTG